MLVGDWVFNYLSHKEIQEFTIMFIGDKLSFCSLKYAQRHTVNSANCYHKSYTGVLNKTWSHIYHTITIKCYEMLQKNDGQNY